MLQLIRSLFPYIKKHYLQALIAALCALPLAGIKGYQAYFVKEIFDKGLSPDTPFEEALRLGGILVGLAILNFPFRYYHFFGMRVAMDRAICAIRRRLFQKYQHLPLSFYADAKQGEMLSRIVSDTSVFAEGIKHSFSFIREPLTAFILLGVACYHDWQLALVIFAVSPFFIIVFQQTGKRVRVLGTKVQESIGEMTHSISEGLSGQKVIKSFNLQDHMLGRFQVFQDRFLIFQNKLSHAEEWSHPVVELIGACGFAGVIIFAHHRISSGELTPGGFLSFTASLALFMDPIRKFSSANVKMGQARAAGERIFGLLNSEEEEDPGIKSVGADITKIELKNIGFSYGDNQVLKDVSFDIARGEKVGLVGLSGSGKSTLVSLLLGLYTPDSGEILIDGVPIQDIRRKDLRQLFALVSQDIFLLNDTIAENIRVGKDVTQAEVDQALEVSNCHEFIREMPEGVETLIGDRGVRLSGGQAQRLTMARAFLRNSPILLFDEATSALDNESEKIVQAAMGRVAGDKTVVAVAHRLSTIQNYDKIIVLKEGHKVEQGTHQDLLSLGGEYAKLYELGQL